MKLNYRRKVCTADMNPYPCSLIEKGRIYGKHIPQFSLSLSLIKLGFSLYPDIYTPKLRYNESRYSEFRDIVNKCQLPLLLTKSRYSEFREIVNKRGLT